MTADITTIQKETRGGQRRGAGRPKGRLDNATLERKKVEAAFNQRVLTHADELFNAQFNLAKGVAHVFRIDETGRGKTKRREHVLVTDPHEIKELLDEHDGGDGMVGDHYYYISTKDSNNIAVDSLLNRGLGKVTDKVDVTTQGDKLESVSNERLMEIAKTLNELKQGNS